jgi:hypothetical protein
MAKIALENSLGHMRDFLQNSGHEVTDMNNLRDCDCCVISGIDENMMGQHDTETQASVINANGMSDQEVLQAVNNRVNISF